MPVSSQVGPASFEFYEGIRILVPGALAAALFGSIIATFASKVPAIPGGALGAITFALMVGLVAYFLDAPAKSAAYRKDTPHGILEEWGLKRPEKVRGMVNVYFLLLDDLMPEPIRNRALYMGSIYRIGWEAIYLIGASSIGVVTASAAIAIDSPTHNYKLPHVVIPGVAALSVVTLALTVHFFAVRLYRERARKKRINALRDACRMMLSQSLHGFCGLPLSLVAAVT